MQIFDTKNIGHFPFSPDQIAVAIPISVAPSDQFYGVIVRNLKQQKPTQTDTSLPSKNHADECCTHGKSSLAQMPAINISGANSTLSAEVPKLLKVSEVCEMLSLQKSAVYNLVATRELSPPLKFGTSRRAAARWLLSDVVNFVQKLADKR